MHAKLSYIFAACLLVSMVGCPSGCKDKDTEKADDSQPPATSLEDVPLKLLVVDDQGLATAIGRSRGEWLAQTGSSLTVESTTEQALRAAESIDADAVLCPSYMVGELAERGLIVPLPESVVEESSDDWQDIFLLERQREAVWGNAKMAVPFGSPVLVCYCRTDILEHLGKRPPRTWSEYLRLAELLADRNNLGELAGQHADQPWHGAIEPLGPGWAGLMLLARAAPLAKHADNYSTLFDIKTMRPLIDGPPFVRALEELVKVAKLNQAAGLAHDPHSARRAFWQGHCGLAITWPTATDVSRNGKEKSNHDDLAAAKKPSLKPPLPCTPIELPGSREVYNIDESRWTTRNKRDEIRVPLLATTGLMGVVSQKSSNPQASAQLLLWLSSSELNPPVGTRSSQTTLYRQSQLRSPQKWVEPEMSLDSALIYCDVVEKAFDRQQWVFALRIPGRAEYLAALDEAVEQAVSSGKSPERALHAAAGKWRGITEKRGRENQRRAYRKSLELRP